MVLALLVVVILRAVGVAEEVGRVTDASVHELGGQNLPGAYGVPLMVVNLVDHTKAVATTQVGVKIDVVPEDLGEFLRYAVRQACCIHGGKQRGLNYAALHVEACVELRRSLCNFELSVVGFDDVYQVRALARDGG